MEARCEWVRVDEKDNEQSQKDRGKIENFKKTAPVSAKHAIFATGSSRHTVASSSRQKTQDQNFEKFSKCFSRLEGLPASESRAEPRKSLSELATGPSTREQVAKNDQRRCD